MMMREHDTEPVPGLPEVLPPGEDILWQGRPNWRSFALHGFHARKLAIYFAVLIAWCSVSLVRSDDPLGWATQSLLPLLGLVPVALALVAILGWLASRTTLYTITNRRVVFRIGIAFPMTINVPFKLIESVGIRSYADGTGEIALTLQPGNNIAYLVMWPHVRPWRLKRAEPSLRCLSGVVEVAELLADALAGGPASPRIAKARPAPAALDDRAFDIRPSAA
jgi:hypothetical protein